MVGGVSVCAAYALAVLYSSRTMAYGIRMSNPRANATTFAACEFCGRSMKVKPMAYRQKFHAACKRKVDLAAKQRGDLHKQCALESCGADFISKRSNAKFCSDRCRAAAHRSSR